MDALKLIAQDSLKAEAPKFNVGDTVKVHVRIAEGDKFRIQIFYSLFIKKFFPKTRRFPPLKPLFIRFSLHSKVCLQFNP